MKDNKLRIFRLGIQIISLFFLFPFFLAIFYCPYRLPWIMCDSCPISWCPSKYLRKPVAFFIGGLAIFSGRSFCGWLCPFGALQDFLNVISRKISKTEDFFISSSPWIKFISLGLTLILILQVIGVVNVPPFNSIPPTYQWLPYLLLIFLFLSVFVSRFWCRFLCPLGALISITNKFSLIKLEVNEKCKKCKICEIFCPMKIEDAGKVNPDSTDCIRCGDCIEKCPEKAISLGFRFP